MTSKPIPQLHDFGELLMRSVRDPAIEACDKLAVGHMLGPDGERWRQLLSDPEVRHALAELIPDIVDQTLFQLLLACDNSLVPLAFRAEDGSCQTLADVGRGEMAGWLMGSPGWRHRFSAQRFFDPLAGLRLTLDPPITS